MQLATPSLLAFLLLAAEPFWNTKAPAEWSAEEVATLLSQSPWATVSKATQGPPVRIHLASAEPMREAENRERQAQRFRVEPGPSFEEYQVLLKEGRYIALAVRLNEVLPASDAIEAISLDRDSILHVGRRQYKLVTHFPPTPTDPYLRYIFPREVKSTDKSLLFDIYIPGIVYPQRHIEFDLRDMQYRGRLAY